MPRHYDWQENDDGTVTVFDVEVLGTMKKSERGYVWTEKDLQEAVRVTNDINGRLGRDVLYIRGHNDFKRGREAEVLGRLRGLYYDGEGWVRARELHVTNPEAVGQMRRGELPTRSPEFMKAGPQRGYIWALATTLGMPGHFDDRLPEIRLREVPANLVQLSSILTPGAEVGTQNIDRPLRLKPKEQTMTLTKEDLDKIVKGTEAVVDKKLADFDKKYEDRFDQLRKNDDNPGEDPIDADKRKRLEAESDTVKKLQAERRQLKIDTFVDRLMSNTSMSRAGAAKLFKDVPDDALDYRFREALATYSPKEHKMDPDETFRDALAGKLEKEFEDLGGEEILGIGKREYVERCSKIANDLDTMND